MSKINKGKIECNEVLAMLDLIPSYDYYKIPSDIIVRLKSNKVEGNDVIINDDFSNISRKAYLIFIKLYRDYIADVEEKEKLDELLKMNDERREEEYQTILKSNSKKIDDLDNAIKRSNSDITVSSEKTFIQKVIDKIKNIFKRYK